MSEAQEAPVLLQWVAGALDDQQDLTAVDRFSQRHQTEERVLHAERYEDLIPLSRAPGEGEQLAFRVDLDRCTGCKACVSACHHLNGLGEGETWRDVGLVYGEESGRSFQQTVTTSCHHCADPACLSGCPVMAYEKDPVTGIVRHLDDQCIGCQYCILKCPYDAPKYEPKLGIVRKCDMCTGRLAEGEAPACVQGCPTAAISIEIVDVADSPEELLPELGGALPATGYTRPTTRYVTERAIESLSPGGALSAGTAHDPLAVMLVLTQLSIGALGFDTFLGGAALDSARLERVSLAALAGVLGLGAATLHLGRPLFAFRAMLGWRTSWMSREILAFGLYVPAVVACAVLCGLARLGPPVGEFAASAFPALESVTFASGLVSLVCSVMIYVDTRRPSWSLGVTASGFLLTMWVLGALAAGFGGVGGPWLILAGALALAGLLVWEFRTVFRVPSGKMTRSIELLRTQLSFRFRLRLVVGASAAVVACIAAVLTASGIAGGSALAAIALGLAVMSELVSRHLFFTAEAARAMPGA